MSRYRLSTSFLRFRPVRNFAPRQAYWNRDGIISDLESPFCRFAEGPTGPRANLRQEAGRSSRDITGLRELVQVGLLQPRLPVSVPGPLCFAPSLRKQAALGGIVVAIIFLPVRAYRRSIWVSVQASILPVPLHRSEWLGIFHSW